MNWSVLQNYITSRIVILEYLQNEKLIFKSCFIEWQCTCNTILIQTDIKKLVNQQLNLKICTLP